MQHSPGAAAVEEAEDSTVEVVAASTVAAVADSMAGAAVVSVAEEGAGSRAAIEASAEAAGFLAVEEAFAEVPGSPAAEPSAVVVASLVEAVSEADLRSDVTEQAAVHTAGSAHRAAWPGEAAGLQGTAAWARSETIRRIFIPQSTMASGIRSATPAVQRISTEHAIPEA